MTPLASRLLPTLLRRADPSVPLGLRAESIQTLAGLLALDLSPRQALMAWHEIAPRDVRPALRRLARRLELGEPLASSLATLRPAFGPDADALRVIVEVMVELGGRAAEAVETLAASVRRRAAFESMARASGSGAMLSGRLIAILPLAFIPLASLTHGPMFDAVGVALLIGGGGLAVAGMAWIARLAPVPPNADDPAAALADLVRAALAGGADYFTVLTLVGRHAPSSTQTELRRAERLVRLGWSWSGALAETGGRGLAGLGAALGRAETLGLSVGSALESWARARRTEAAHEFEAATRRAAVLMMIPLATCVLPSFLLLAVAPFLRGLSLQ